MIPGPFSICKVDFPEDSDSPIYTTLTYGYDSAKQAFDAIPEVAKESEVSEDEVAVIRSVDKEEVDKIPGY